ncbi:MAG TPA: hypothetical protein VEZ11_18850 [Thermoanaerobaculia bacterium]|nr:hypothetical protein [Thermoanaerobaculia bacterium]
MPLTWEIEDTPDHLLARVEGSWQIRTLLQLIDEMGRRARLGGHSRIFCDCREVTGMLGEIDRYLAGSHGAYTLGATKLVALVHPDSVVNEFAMKAAARRGGRLFTTKDPEVAREWLFAEEAKG